MTTAEKKVFVRVLLTSASLTVLGIAIFVIWRVQLAHQVRTKLADLRAAGIPTTGSDLNALYPPAPDFENAALVVTQALASLTELPVLKLPKTGKGPTREQREKMGLFVETNRIVFTKLQEILRLKKSHYPVDFTPGNDTPLPHLRGLEKLSTLLKCQTILSTGESNENKTVNSIVLQLALAHTLDSEPVLISKLVACNMGTGAVEVLNFALNNSVIGTSNLLLLQNELERFGTNGDLSVPITSDLAMTLPEFQKNWREIRRLFWVDDSFLLPLSDAIRGTFGGYTGLFDRDELFFIDAMQDAIREVRQPYPECLTTYQSMYKAAMRGHRSGLFMGPMRLNGARRAVAVEADFIALIRSAQTALAVERFRLTNEKLPEKLDDLIPQYLSVTTQDPYDGQPLRYKRLDKGYVVYSVGRDGEDNDGRRKPVDTRPNDSAPHDITFTVER